MLAFFNSFAVFTDEQTIEAHNEIAPWRIYLKEGKHFDVSLTGRKSVEAIVIKMEVVNPHVCGRNRRYALRFAVSFIMLE